MRDRFPVVRAPECRIGLVVRCRPGRALDLDTTRVGVNGPVADESHLSRGRELTHRQRNIPCQATFSGASRPPQSGWGGPP
jgi:hypothetical protein